MPTQLMYWLLVPLFLGAPQPPTASADAPAQTWEDQASESVRAGEFDFTATSDETYTAPNRAHGFRVRIDGGVVELTSRVRGEDPDKGGFKLRLSSLEVGRYGNLAAIPRTAPTVYRGHVVRERAQVTDWYNNDDDGLEQGFTIASPPDGLDPSELLLLRVGLEGNLTGRLTEDGRAVLFADASGRDVLRYASLRVTDANDREIPSSLAVSPGAIEIRIDARDASYPLTIDPLITSPVWTAESNQANSEFATVVATAGDVNGDGFSDVVIGAPFYDNGQSDEGRVFVYLGSSSGPAATAAWTTESDQANAQFGASVGTAGDMNGDGYDDVVVGAPLYDNGQTDEGRIYVYLGSASGLAGSSSLTAEVNQASAHFGASVAAAGDTNGDGFDDIIVGAPLFDNGQTDEGRAYIYRGSATPLSTSPSWNTESNQASAEYGRSVAGAGDVNGDRFADVVVGAPFYDNGQSNEGRAFVFHGSASGPSTSASRTEESDQASAEFGSSVAGAGDVNGDGYSDLIVGAHLFDNGESNEGRAFIYFGSASGLSATASWTAESDQAASDFGLSVATAGDINGDGYSDVVVGAPLYKNGQRDEGLAYLYLGSASGPSTQASWTTENDQADSHLGSSVSTAGDVNGDGYSDVIVGAPLFANGQTNEGRASLFTGSAGALATVVAWTSESDQTNGYLGYAVGSAGDVNGDGYGDTFVGIPYYDNAGGTDAGRVLVYYGSSTGLPTVASWTGDGTQANDRYGYTVAGAGDVNGDGYSDLIVGAYGFDNGQTDEGRAYVYLGSASGLATSASWITESNQAGAQFGSAVAGAGDVNGDGFADVIVGAFAYDNGQTDEGRAFVYLGSPSGLAASPVWTAESNQANAYFGSPVASAGDVDRDGFSDVVIGAWQYSGGESLEGRAYLYRGSLTGPSAAPDWITEGNQAGALYGFPVSGVGDVNGDGYSDVLVGATAFDQGFVDEGMVFLYLGSASGLSMVPSWSYAGGLDAGSFGYIRAAGGDLNGDGYSDLVVGAPYFEVLFQDEGQEYLFLGSPTGPGSSPNWTMAGGQVAAFFGYSSGYAGDVNGDGYGDLIIGSYAADLDQLNEGRAVLYYGNAGPGISRIPRQTNSAGTAPIDLLGKTGTDYSFRLRATGRTAAGRGRVRLEYEVKPLGTPFDPAGTQTTSLTDTGAPGASGSGVAFDQLISGLTPGTPYRWRVRFPAKSPFFPRTPWFSLTNNAPGETDLRTPLCLDTDGDGYGSPGDLSCPAGPGLDCNDGNNTVYPGAPELCDNLDNNCDSTVDGFPTACGLGACARTGACTAGSNSCSPGSPTAEVCDNIDNNCDGTIDSFPTSCGTGACARTGTCTAGSNSCAPGTPTAELCDNIDNNCDGTIDGFATSCGIGACASTGTCTAGSNSCSPGSPTVEVCDNIDNNCDGTIDGFATSCGVGACASTGTCTAGSNSCSPGSPTAEACDNIDNNCDGTIDSFPTTCGIGACQQTGSCSAGHDSCTPLVEVCDNIDNDCDGTIDGIPTTCGIGACVRAGVCTAGANVCTPGAPVTETCDSVDNNCDGAVDNVPPAAGTLVLTVTKTLLSWTAAGNPGVRYDVTRGNLQTLHSSQGNFTTSTDACVVNNRNQLSFGFTTNPTVGQGFWILLRATNTGCGGGNGSYDSGAFAQVGSRDSEIAASSNACP